MSTPIDPISCDRLLDVYEQAESQQWLMTDDGPDRWDYADDVKRAALYAVARAVCPEHHVVVPVETLRFVIDADQWDDDTYFRAVETLRSLLPTEEATR